MGDVTVPRCLLLLAIVFAMGAAVAEKIGAQDGWSGDYLIALPKALQLKTQHAVYVQIQDKNIAMRIDSTNPSNNETVTGAMFIFLNGSGLREYQIPFADYLEKSIRLTFIFFSCPVDVSKCSKSPGNQLFNKSTVFPIIRDTVMIFTETNKPIYKPGETVKFRILPILLSTLRTNQIVNGKPTQPVIIDVAYIQAPNKMRMYQQNNITWQEGLKGFSYALSDDPLFGKWKIVVQIGSVKDTQNFIVKKYVLPKFTVTPEPPSYIFIGDSVVKFRVCAKYSTGRTMKAIVHAELCIKYQRKRMSRGYRRLRERLRPCIQRTKRLDGSKNCVDFEESTTPFKLRDSRFSLWGQKAILNASVIEDGTNVTVIKTQTGGDIKTSPFTLTSDGSSKIFRNGLPYYGQIRALNHDLTPRSYESLKIEVNSFWSIGWGFSETTMTDANGVINFGIPPFPSSATSVSIRVSSVAYSNIDRNVKNRLRITNPYTSIYVRQAYSPSNTYIQLYPLNQQPAQTPCLTGKLRIQLQSTVPLHNRTIRALIMSRGVIQTIELAPPTAENQTKCQDQDSSELGHYTCVVQENGVTKIRCLPGWKGTNCMTPICENGCLEGVCRSPGRCVCRKGWRGPACNDCIRRNKCVYGFCRFGHDCYCLPGYYGVLCTLKRASPNNSTTIIPIPINPLPVNKTEKYDPSTQLEELKLFTRVVEIGISPQLYPSAKIVLWFTHKSTNQTEIIPAVVELDNLRKCLNKSAHTSFSFNKRTVRPGENITATVKTSGKNVTCALAVSDVALEAFGNLGGISEENLVKDVEQSLEKLQQWNSDDPYYVLRQEYCRLKMSPRLPPLRRRVPRMIWWRPRINKKGWSSFFRSAGLFVISNVPLMQSDCEYPVMAYTALQGPQPMARGGVRRPAPPGAGPGLSKKNKAKLKEKIKTRVRKFFPETWLFESLTNQEKNITRTVPDSVTSWKSTMYCISTNGLGLSPPDRLVVFQEFFLQMALPYSLTRGESAKIPVKVFSYRQECSEITLTMNASVHLTSNGPQVVRSCVCNFDQITVYFRVQPNKLGKVPVEVEAVSRPSLRCPNPKTSKAVSVVADAVRRKLLVVAEGLPEEISVGDLLCAGGKSASVRLTIQAPKKSGLSIVDGSERGYVMWSGNVLGSSLENLDSMVRMPYGCGEQNMMSMVPSIYLLDYFTKAGINNTQVMKKAIKFILIGVQRQMAYRLDNGSYSAFGKRDKFGSTWLTAFVFRSFVAARQYVNIDSKVLSSALKFLLSKTTKSGCFREDGRVFSSSLKGGQGKGKDEVAITAYILAALVEANGVNNSLAKETAPGISAAVRCLNITGPRNDSALRNMSNYGVALRTYALTLWNATNNLTKLFRQELQRRQTKKDGFVYWKANNTETRGQYMRPWYSFVSADVETTAYALLSKLATMGSAGAELISVLPIVRWVTGQRNGNGGWYSTQDTVTALQALAGFGIRTSGGGKETNLNVTIKTGTSTQTVKVTNTNKLVLYKMPIAVPNSLTVTANGDGCLVAQANVLFNVKDTRRPEAPFFLRASATQNPELCDIARVRVCALYTGAAERSGMAVIKARMVSGWQVTRKSISELNDQVIDGGLKLIEVDPERSLVLYFDYFTETKSCIEFDVQRDIEVNDAKPMLIQVYDYYKPHEAQEESVQIVSEECDKSSKQPQNDDSETQCPLCTVVNDSAIAIVERLCSKPHFFAAVERENAAQKWRYTERVGDIINEWNAAINLGKGCDCLFSSRMFIAIHTRWRSLAMDEDVSLDADWTVINMALLSTAGEEKLRNSCVKESEAFTFGYDMFLQKKKAENMAKAKAKTKGQQMPKTDS